MSSNENSIPNQNNYSVPLIKDPIVQNFYKCQPNYYIETTESPTDRCVIYFSSHGIYYPDDIATFTTAIINGDRYDWKKNKLLLAKKHIFVRDIFKQWYVEGINGELNTVEKLAAWLKQETAGMQIITLGSSAGAYAAVLFGCLLQADYVFAFSPQFDLNVHDTKRDALIELHRQRAAAKYYNLYNLIKQSHVPIFYFYGSRSNQDNMQAAVVKDLPNVYSFKLASEAHGVPFFFFDFNKLLNLPKQELFSLFRYFNNQLISRLRFSIKLNGYFRFINLYSQLVQKTLVKKMRSLL